MTRRIILCLISCFVSISIIHAATFYQPQPNNLYIVDDFEDADLTLFPEWWGFGKIELSIQPNEENAKSYLGKRSLELRGPPEQWYVGGVGSYFGIDVSRYNAIKLLVKGYGPKSGVLIIELFDDDNNNYEIEPHPEDKSELLHDDKFIHTLKVDWTGWRVVIIHFDRFVDGNLGFGDDKWNPYQENSSGGLLQIQLVLLAADKEVEPHLNIDMIKFYEQGPMPMKKDGRAEYVGEDDFF